MEVPGGLSLQPGEAAVFVAGASRMKDQTTRQYSPGRRGTSIRIAKGLSFRVGAYRGTTHVSTQTVVDDSGYLVLTTRRILFMGAKRTTIIPINSLIAAYRDDDGFVVLAKEGRATTDRFAVSPSNGFLARLAAVQDVGVSGRATRCG